MRDIEIRWGTIESATASTILMTVNEKVQAVKPGHREGRGNETAPANICPARGMTPLEHRIHLWGLASRYLMWGPVLFINSPNALRSGWQCPHSPEPPPLARVARWIPPVADAPGRCDPPLAGGNPASRRG